MLYLDCLCLYIIGSFERTIYVVSQMVQEDQLCCHNKFSKTIYVHPFMYVVNSLVIKSQLFTIKGIQSHKPDSFLCEWWGKESGNIISMDLCSRSVKILGHCQHQALDPIRHHFVSADNQCKDGQNRSQYIGSYSRLRGSYVENNSDTDDKLRTVLGLRKPLEETTQSSGFFCGRE